MLRNQGDIWLISTEYNPCKLVDIWNNGDLIRENIRNLCVFEGTFTRWNSIPGHDTEKFPGFTFIFGATSNGQVLILENDGYIGSRAQVNILTLIY